jgi:hypothetical protein
MGAATVPMTAGRAHARSTGKKDRQERGPARSTGPLTSVVSLEKAAYSEFLGLALKRLVVSGRNGYGGANVPFLAISDKQIEYLRRQLSQPYRDRYGECCIFQHEAAKVICVFVVY